MNKTLSGKVWKYGDNIDTDVIIPARHLTRTDPGELAKHCMEDIDKSFAENVAPGDIIVGGANFGCGSSREHAPLAILGAGVSAVVAASFARIFFRNAINIGLPILECPDLAARAQKGDRISIDLGSGRITIEGIGEPFASGSFPPFLADLIDAGGLVPYARQRLRGEV